ncbi:MAG: GNAT family N-acetyltransferase [Marinilabiliales bacterium]|nr:GNAT family N-acetyltransferase [Marinilabiliales bacterium]
MENLTIRLVQESDLPQMIAARIDYLTEMQGERSADYKQELAAQLLTMMRGTLKEGSFFALLAEADGVTVSYGGMIVKKIPGDFNRSSYLEGEILNMYTLPAFRRKGISSAILQALLDRARALGITKVALHCSKDGEPLYRKFGFSDPVYPYLERMID